MAAERPLSSAPDSPLVLVVDPSPDFRRILKELLEHHGYAVVDTGDPEEAFGIACARQPAAIIGEHPLLLGDGRPLCRALLARPAAAAIPFLALTARALPAELDDARRTHPHGVRTKPLPLDDILSVLEELCGGADPSGDRPAQTAATSTSPSAGHRPASV